MLAVRDTSNVYIVPAMNTFMYRNPIIQDNMNKLIKLGFNFVKPDSGLLACGDVGEGKFPSIEKIESFVFRKVEQDLKGKKVLVTAGPTKEFIDPFRCLTNPSTGKMGISIANECARRGAEVILVSSVDNDSISLFEVGGLLETLKEVLQMDVDLLTDGNKLTKRFQENLYRDMIHIYGDIYGEQRYIS